MTCWYKISSSRHEAFSDEYAAPVFPILLSLLIIPILEIEVVIVLHFMLNCHKRFLLIGYGSVIKSLQVMHSYFVFCYCDEGEIYFLFAVMQILRLGKRDEVFKFWFGYAIPAFNLSPYTLGMSKSYVPLHLFPRNVGSLQSVQLRIWLV